MAKYKVGGLMELRTCPRCRADNWPSASMHKGHLVLYCPECGYEAMPEQTELPFNWAGWTALIFFAMLMAAIVAALINLVIE